MILYNASERNMENLHRKNVVPMCTCTSCVHSYESAFEDKYFRTKYFRIYYLRISVRRYHSVYEGTFVPSKVPSYLRIYFRTRRAYSTTLYFRTKVLPYRISISQYFRSVFYCTKVHVQPCAVGLATRTRIISSSCIYLRTKVSICTTVTRCTAVHV